jgi:hypothetical protein
VFLELISIVLLSAFPRWESDQDPETGSLIDIKPFPSRKLILGCLTTTGLSTVLALIATLWQHVSGTTLTALAKSSFAATVYSKVGALSISFLWLSTLFSLCTFIGIYFMFTSMNILNEMLGVGAEDSD